VSESGRRGTPQPARRQQQVTPASSRSFIGFILVIALIGAGLGVGGTLGWQWFDRTHNQPISVDYPEHPAFTSDDGNIMLNGELPDGAVGTEYDKKYIDTINKNPQLAFKALTTPVDITLYDGPDSGKIINDQIESDKVTVTLKYDPALIPKGLTSLQVGMVVYDEQLQSWVPILNAKADPKTNTVTARAPHFSWFSAIVLDPAKNVVNVAGQAIQSTIDSFTTVTSWLVQVVAKVASMLANDLGVPPELKCDKESKAVSVSVASPFDALKGCVETAAPLDRVKLRNGYAFPVYTEDKLPDGLTLSMDDVWDNGANLQDAVRSMFWANQHKLYVPGTSIGSVTATAGLSKPTTLKFEVEGDALAFDMGFAALSVLAPEAAGSKAAIKTVVEKIVSGATVSRETIDKASSWVAQTYDLADCTVGAAHDIDQPYDDAGMNAAAGVAHDCLGGIFDGLNLEGALADLLSNLKVIPGMVEATLYGTSKAVLDGMPVQLDGIKMKSPTATITRNGAAPQAEPGKDDKDKQTTAPANEGNWGNYKSLIGTWKGGDLTIDIKDGAVGTFTWSPAACPNDRDSGKFTWCTIKGDLSFMPSDKSTVWFHVKSTVSVNGGDKLTLLPEVDQKIQAFGGYVTLAGDKHSVLIDMPAHPGSSIEYCDDYMLKFSNDTNSPHWKRCDGNAR
jgi:hypothetical protein